MQKREWSQWREKIVGGNSILEEVVKFIKSNSPVSYEEVRNVFPTQLPEGWSEQTNDTAIRSQLLLFDNYGAIEWDIENNIIKWTGN